MKSFLPALLSNLVFLGILLVSAGSLGYWPAWVYLVIGLVMAVLTKWILSGVPDLEKERTRPGPGAKAWDKKLLGVNFLLTLVMLVVAGLDAGRYHWVPRLTWPWLVAGIVLSLVGMGIFLFALKENRFFSSVVRVQSDRGHTVCRTGPYRVVRHPGNAGMILGTLGLPLLLMSAWSGLPALLCIVVMVERTRLEDAALEHELEGYREYQRTTRYRLIPGIW